MIGSLLGLLGGAAQRRPRAKRASLRFLLLHCCALPRCSQSNSKESDRKEKLNSCIARRVSTLSGDVLLESHQVRVRV